MTTQFLTLDAKTYRLKSLAIEVDSDKVGRPAVKSADSHESSSRLIDLNPGAHCTHYSNYNNMDCLILEAVKYFSTELSCNDFLFVNDGIISAIERPLLNEGLPVDRYEAVCIQWLLTTLTGPSVHTMDGRPTLRLPVPTLPPFPASLAVSCTCYVP